MSVAPLYARWLEEALGHALPEERRATCDTCVLCPESTQVLPKHLATFDARTKCCTYLPALANYQVGAILRSADVHDHGRSSVLERVAAHVAVTPHGLGWPAAFEAMYDEDNDAHFGRRLEMRCPHYVDEAGGLCGIWKHRNGICSTWFCRLERGKVGKAFWGDVQDLLEEIESVLGWWCVEQLDVGTEAWDLLQQVDDPRGSLDGSIPITEDMRRAVWGPWFGRELAFYEESARLVADMSWRDVVDACGGAVRSKARTLAHSDEDHQNIKIPPWVRLERPAILEDQGASVWVSAYNSYEAIEVPRALLDALEDHGVLEVDEVCDLLTEHLARPVSRTDIRRWMDLGLLVQDWPW